MATDLELLVNPEAYQARISMLEGYVASLQGIQGEYQSLSAEAVNVFGDDDANLAQAQEAVNKAAQVVGQKIVGGNVQGVGDHDQHFKAWTFCTGFDVADMLVDGSYLVSKFLLGHLFISSISLNALAYTFVI